MSDDSSSLGDSLLSPKDGHSQCDDALSTSARRMYAWDGPEDQEIAQLKAEVDEQERQLAEHEIHVLESESQLETMIKDLRSELQVRFHDFPWQGHFQKKNDPGNVQSEKQTIRCTRQAAWKPFV
jgi:hypothetical protein